MKSCELSPIFFTPHPLLQPFVQCIMLIHVELPRHVAAPVALYQPTPQTSLFFYLNDRISVQSYGSTKFIDQPRSVIVGQQLKPVAIDVNYSHRSVRVGFHPGGLHRLLGLSMAEMIDGSYDAEDVFGKEMKELNQKLQEANSPGDIRDQIEAFLLARVSTLKNETAFDNAMLQLLKHGGNISVDDLAALSYLSVRQFERVCRERIGLSPKLYSRLVRFSKAYRMREEAPDVSWTMIAHDCGYFDQMHFIKDFKEFSGATPGNIDKELEQIPVRMQEKMRI